MTTIWEIKLETTDHQQISVPEDAKFLTVQAQYGEPCLWFKCDPDAPKVSRDIAIYGTGHKIESDDEPLEYIGTYQLVDDQLIFHVFEMLSST